MTPSQARTTLKWFLRFIALGVAVRIFLVLVPADVWAFVPPLLGLGEYPRAPMMQFIMNAISMAYFLSGVFCWILSRDIQANERLIRFLAWSSFCYGLLIPGVDWLTISVPPLVTILALSAVVFGIVMLLLLKQARIERLPRQAPQVLTLRDKLLRLYLAGIGLAMLPALAGLLLPKNMLMAGLGDMHTGFQRIDGYPDAPIFHVHFRLASGACFFGGIFFWILSRDVDRYRGMIRFVGWSSIVFGMIMSIVEFKSPLPLWLYLPVGPGALLSGILVLSLLQPMRTMPPGVAG